MVAGWGHRKAQPSVLRVAAALGSRVTSSAACGPPTPPTWGWCMWRSGARPPWELRAVNVLEAHHGSGLADLLMEQPGGDAPATLWGVRGNRGAGGLHR